MSPSGKILIFIVAYNAEKTLDWVLDRVPQSVLESGAEILVIDDSSKDSTFEVGLRYKEIKPGVKLTMLRTPTNQGYGGNQKLGYRYAIEKDFDAVVLIHGDGQYPPEMIEPITEPILSGQADAVFGSRMLEKGALKGGMPLYKFVGNKILTTFQNWWLGSSLSEFHSGFRAYSVSALAQVPFENNTNDFHFDTEIIIQFFRKNLRIHEIPIPTYYGDEICHVNGMKYAWDVVKATLLSKIQNLGLFYQRKFDVGKEVEYSPYRPKLGFRSSHTMAIENIMPGETVLDLGCGQGIVAKALKEKGCTVFAADKVPITDAREFCDHFEKLDLDSHKFPEALSARKIDTILLLDILEHLKDPEGFLDSLRNTFGVHTPRVIISTGNVAFFPLRFVLLFGGFNYGPRGILDKDHKRLFTFRTLKLLLEESGFQVSSLSGVPAPFPLALGDSVLSQNLLRFNSLLTSFWRSLFSYQIFATSKMTPSVEAMLSTMSGEDLISSPQLRNDGLRQPVENL